MDMAISKKNTEINMTVLLARKRHRTSSTCKHIKYLLFYLHNQMLTYKDLRMHACPHTHATHVYSSVHFDFDQD